MSIKRYGAEGGKGTGGQHLPFARAVEADGWLYVSGQVPMLNGFPLRLVVPGWYATYWIKSLAHHRA